ncbi:type II toxin-antitoxin system death-on-curing family toxin [Calidifontibacter sp. DB0510]|uniref:Type II toxin-antitoxin system death-on-curing family toxin n=1 Tax=Metallococcus carri TaxID=1656884 RepID=A0A967AX07_9MICO|nr:type II toxin-antitoxin system death-on-curing family toxin [Metallococcus carri]NHN54263.1 type II toxin-antitoxin system death-on-curing family toxin [Metallococcus carri]NOP36897.1 type II toxin-antitoxin system death-on-curing family toxin [Calidifontibacter sp. DB2511S]
MTDPIYLDLDDLVLVATGALGRPPEVRDWGLLEAALARPRATVFGQDAYGDLYLKAAALLSSLVKGRALVDGNKRTGLIATRLFLAMNGIRFTGTDDDKFTLALDVADDTLGSVEEIAARLRDLTTSTTTGAQSW